MKSNSFIFLLTALIVILGSYLILRKSGWIGAASIQEQARDSRGIEISIQLDTVKEVPNCQKYQFIELHFAGELGESLRVVTACRLFVDENKNNILKIPFQHIFTFSPQSGEFTTQSETKIYIRNHQPTWSKKWKLAAFYFSNSDQDRISVPRKKLNLDVEYLFSTVTN